METGERFAELLGVVEGLDLFRNPRRIERPLGRSGAALEGEVDVEGQEVTLRLVLDQSFPLTLPIFLLRPWDALGFIPHVSQSGFVCFLDREGLVLDRRRPVSVIEDAFCRTIGVLSDGMSGRNLADFADEFEVYWSSLPGDTTAFSVLDADDNISEVVLAFAKDELRWVAREEGDVAAFYNGACIGGKYTLRNALYLPLEPGTLLVPPRPDGPMWTAQDARRVLLPGLAEASRARLRRLIKGRPRAREYVIVKLPRPSDGASLFGLRYEGVSKRHPLHEEGTAERLIPIQIRRLDRAYLIGRGGGDAALGAKRVLLVGCGAVGGHAAFELARAGVFTLTLVDPDTLWPENTFRHVLGHRYWAKAKAEALKEALANRAAFAAPGQLFGRALSGCGSLHTPFGSVDAVRTAALAARLAIDALTGTEPGNPLRSWKGDAAAFEAAGFRPSPRYGASRDELDRQQYSYRSVRCPVCGALAQEGAQ
ncbi:MAG: E2/UBC family protein [Thermomicrobiales bacterium]